MQPQPFSGWVGPRNPRILFIGEAWGRDESATRQPFSGESGKEFFRMLGEAFTDFPAQHTSICSQMRYGLTWVRHREPWLRAEGLAFTNVLNLHPPDNNLTHLCYDNKSKPKGYTLPVFTKAKTGGHFFLREEYFPQLQRLEEEITAASPNLLVLMGNTALWAFTHSLGISGVRGTITLANGRKILPTFHPATLLHGAWSQRPIILADFLKAKSESSSPDLRRPQRHILINPTISEVEAETRATLAHPPPLLSCDIETKFTMIKTIGFARSTSYAFIIPFFNEDQTDWNYWPDAATEERAWLAAKSLLEAPIPKLFQNGLYDLQYLLRMGFRPAAIAEDTMLLHHSLYPELPKSLGFLGSIYTNESAWKLMRRQKADTEKRDE